MLTQRVGYVDVFMNVIQIISSYTRVRKRKIFYQSIEYNIGVSLNGTIKSAGWSWPFLDY